MYLKYGHHMVIFKISPAGIAQTHFENHDATNSPHDRFAVTTNLFVVTTNEFVVTTNHYKSVCSNYKQVLSILQKNAFSARKELRASNFTMHQKEEQEV